MTPAPHPGSELGDQLLDSEAMETPRRLSRDEHRAVAGPDWTWSRPKFEEDDND